jgi:hypothetical protein
MSFENKIELLSDPKEEIKFWANLLENDKLNKESIELVNQGLQNAIKVFLKPYYIKIDQSSLEEQNVSIRDRKFKKGDIVYVLYSDDIPSGFYEVVSVNPMYLRNEAVGCYNEEHYNFGNVKLVCPVENRVDLEIE